MAKLLCVFIVLIVCGAANAGTSGKPQQSVAVRNVASQSIESLRADGRAGLDRALASYDKVRAELAQVAAECEQLHQKGYGDNKQAILALEKRMEDLNRRIDAMQLAIDQIGGQRGCSVSRLYWYTDLDEAKAEAERTGRPILSLRMLGKLTDEYSCANSRFFRTALYSNKDDQRLSANEFRAALAKRAAGAAGDDRLRRWPQARADAHGQQRALCAGERRHAARRVARVVQPAGVSAMAVGRCATSS